MISRGHLSDICRKCLLRLKANTAGRDHGRHFIDMRHRGEGRQIVTVYKGIIDLRGYRFSGTLHVDLKKDHTMKS